RGPLPRRSRSWHRGPAATRRTDAWQAPRVGTTDCRSRTVTRGTAIPFGTGTRRAVPGRALNPQTHAVSHRAGGIRVIDMDSRMLHVLALSLLVAVCG